MGWSIDEPLEMSGLGAQVVWPAFQQGYTADDARLRLYRRYCQYCQENPQYGSPDPSDDAGRSTIHVFGDLYSRLHGVYTGAAGAVTDWYR